LNKTFENIKSLHCYNGEFIRNLDVINDLKAIVFERTKNAEILNKIDMNIIKVEELIVKELQTVISKIKNEINSVLKKSSIAKL
jgi:hypothetical protein